MLAHNVYFLLNDNSPAAVKAMVDDCHVYLAHLPGIVFYAAGTPSDIDRPISDREYDVALHVVFQDSESLDTYLNHPKHVEFAGKYRSNWKDVRAFDSIVAGGK
jgi:SPX domain protein involved in polyphosphate accumulation